MKKILFIIISITLLSWCVKITLNDSKTSTWVEISPSEIKNNSGSTQAAEEVLEEIENTTDEELSQALLDFLSQENIDYKTEIQKTLARYNDNFWPVLEYKHQVKPKEEEEEEEVETLSWSTQNSDNNGTDDNFEESFEDKDESDELNESSDTQENDDEVVIQDNNYSWEVKISDEQKEQIEDTPEENNKQDEFTSVTKVWKSWTYVSFTPNGSKCDWGLEMTDNQWNSKWLFYNSCDKIIYDFELDFWGINIFYKDENWISWEQFVTIE